jgi:cell division septum initiation protein DivIVA
MINVLEDYKDMLQQLTEENEDQARRIEQLEHELQVTKVGSAVAH